MKSIRSLICLFLSFVLLFSFSACSVPEESDENTEAEVTEAPAKEEDSEKESEKEEEKEERPDEKEPGEDRKSYSVRYVSELSADAVVSSVHSVFTSELYPFSLSLVYDGGEAFLADYGGNVQVTLPLSEGSEFLYCPVCKCITDHAVKVDPVTLEVTEHFMGHGFSANMYYYYDEERGLLFNELIGGYASPVESTDGAFVVNRLVGREATESEKLMIGSDIYYEAEYKYGILIDGELVVPCEYDYGLNFSGGMCVLSKGGKWGCFDESGNIVFDVEYSDIGKRLSYGLIPLCKDGMWAYGNTDGTLVTDFEFESACDVYNGLAWVKQDGVWKVIEFLKYDEGISEFEAQQLLERALERTGSYVSISVDPLPEEEQITCYSTEGYCFSTELMNRNGYINTNMRYIVLPDGTYIPYIVE